mmetsp:Transcript_86063/g.263378  ORF Transcript_86063/g.263378 Transcript_86063/m.263378 type:complete len:212 (-) Transcript_86063:623-1258(-)
MFDAMMPVGPRFTHPATYRPPAASSTRPCLWGTLFRPSNGRPSIGVMSKPTLRTTMPHAMSSASPPLDRTAACWPGSPCSSFRWMRSPPTLEPSSLGKTSQGELKNLRCTIRLDVVPLSAKLRAIFSRMSTDRFFILLFDNSCSLAAFRDKANSAGSTMGRTSSYVSSSRSSLLVKAAWMKPRRPMTCTVCKPSRCHAAICARAAPWISVA